MKGLLKNNWVIGGGVVIVLFLVYYFYFSGSSAPLLTAPNDAASPVSQNLLATLGSLHTIKLDSSIFADPVYASLTDFGVTIPPQAAGRRNPFAPLGGGISAPAKK